MTKGDLTRQAVLAEATRLASRVGLTGLTIGSLAAEAELSKSGLYAHFRSKEALQIQVLDNAAALYRERVILPALAAPRGEPRVLALFERWLKWADDLPGGCLFVTAAVELDDRPGPVREHLVRSQRDWLDAVATVFRGGVADGQFAPDADPEQFAQDFHGILLGHHFMHRLLGEQAAGVRARHAVDALLATARAG